MSFKEKVKALPDGLIAQVSEKLDDQNFMQTTYSTANIIFELYRAVTSSLLILFVYQECAGGQQCSMKQNLEGDNNDFYPMYLSGLVFNFLTLGAFLFLYYVEFRRELLLIEYLEVNDKLKYDNAAVEQNLKLNLPADKMNLIHNVDLWYNMCGKLALVMYAVNILISAVVISHYYAGFTTITSFLMALLFIIKKLISVYFVIYSEPHVFQSGFQVKSLQYNDVDPLHTISHLRKVGDGEYSEYSASDNPLSENMAMKFSKSGLIK